MRVLGPSGLERSYTLVGSAGEHQPLLVANVILRLLPAKTSRRERDLYSNVLVKGPIPHDSAPTPLVSFLANNLVANCAE